MTGGAGNEVDTDTVDIGVIPQVWYIDENGGQHRCSRFGQPIRSRPLRSSIPRRPPPVARALTTISSSSPGPIWRGLNLEDGQQVYGADQPLSFADPFGGPPIVIQDGTGARPTINVAAAGRPGYRSRVRQYHPGRRIITTAAGTTGIDDGSGAVSVGNLTVANVAVSGAGKAVDIDGGGGTFNVVFESLSSSGGTEGIQLAGAWSGTFNGGTGTLSGHSATEVDVNGGAGTFSYGGAINDGTGLSVSIANRTGGAVTLSGNITDGADAGGGISVGSNASSTITFNGQIALNTGAQNGVNLTSNGASTINFNAAGNGLDITTTTGIGFNATGPGPAATSGGTVNVQGTGNTITSAGGIALNVINTAIGANDLNFQSISANGGANGIVLNNTGTTAAFGGLTVTGDASTSDNGSGGTIQGTTGVGILLTSTRDVSLDQMNINNSGDDGIRGQGVTNFTLNRSNLSNNGNATAENGIQFGEATGSVAGLLGTASILNTDVSGSAGNNVHIRNTSGTLDSLVVTNSSFNNLNDVTGANSFLFEASGTATVTEAFITGSTFSNNSPQRALEVQAHDTATISDFVVSGNTFIGNGIHASFTQDTSSNLEFYLVNNSITTPNTADNVLQAVNVFSSSQSTGGTIVGTISGNVINTNGEDISGISVVIQGRTDATLLIDGNTVSGTAGNRGIAVAFRGPTSALGPVITNDVTITNNNVNMGLGSGFPLAAISVEADNQSGNDSFAPIVRADIAGNTVPGGSAFDLTSAYLQFYEYDAANGHGVGQLVDRAPASASADAQLAGANTGSTDAFGVDLISGPINLPPSVPTPLLAAAGGVASSSGATGDHDLDTAELAGIVQAAIVRWADTGLTDAQLAELAGFRFEIADLGGSYLGLSLPGLVLIDSDADEHGWFIDATPFDDAEFGHALSATQLQTDASGAPAGQMDLLTLVMHEIGHALGLDHIA